MISICDLDLWLQCYIDDLKLSGTSINMPNMNTLLIGLKMKVESVRQIFKFTVWYDIDLWLSRQICDLNPSL